MAGVFFCSRLAVSAGSSPVSQHVLPALRLCLGIQTRDNLALRMQIVLKLNWSPLCMVGMVT